MKKYIIPAIIIADIENEVILAGSNQGFGSDELERPSDIGARDRGLFDWNED